MTSVDRGLAVELTELTRVYGSMRALDGLTLHLVDLEPDEAARVGPDLLDRYLALAVDVPAGRASA